MSALEYYIVICGKAVKLDQETYDLICANPAAMTIIGNINTLYDQEKQNTENEKGSKSN